MKSYTGWELTERRKQVRLLCINLPNRLQALQTYLPSNPIYVVKDLNRNGIFDCLQKSSDSGIHTSTPSRKFWEVEKARPPEARRAMEAMCSSPKQRNEASGRSARAQLVRTFWMGY